MDSEHLGELFLLSRKFGETLGRKWVWSKQ